MRSAMRKRGEFSKTIFCWVVTKARQAWLPGTAVGRMGRGVGTGESHWSQRDFLQNGSRSRAVVRGLRVNSVVGVAPFLKVGPG